MERDLYKLRSKVQDINYANALYASMCNMKWLDHVTNEEWSCTWRYSGDIVAQLRNNNEDYMDFYCNGNEGTVREDVLKDLHELGWSPKPWGND